MAIRAAGSGPGQATGTPVAAVVKPTDTLQSRQVFGSWVAKIKNSCRSLLVRGPDDRRLCPGAIPTERPSDSPSLSGRIQPSFRFDGYLDPKKHFRTPYEAIFLGDEATLKTRSTIKRMH